MMIAAEVAVLTQTLALLPPLRIFGKFLNVLIQQFELFSVLAVDKNHTHADLFSS